MTSWFDNAVIYQILVDRFAGYDIEYDPTSVGWAGGNLKAIVQKLPYLGELGIDALLLSPVNQCESYHGYDITDFEKIDPMFGTKADMINLIGECHAQNIKIIIDYVPNHCSSKHPYFLDAVSDPSSKYRDWFTFTSWPDEYYDFFGFNTLPKLNLENPACREYMLGVAKMWVQEFDVDGFRLDHVPGPSIGFWNDFVSVIKAEKKECIAFGEVAIDTLLEKYWHLIGLENVKEYVLRNEQVPKSVLVNAIDYYSGVLDGCINFAFYSWARQYIQGSISFSELLSNTDDYINKFKPDFKLPLMLSNHDNDRMVYLAKNNIEMLKRVVKLQFSLNQPAIIYYGEEIGMSQTKPIKVNTGNPLDDLPVRQPMVWDADLQDHDLLEFYKKQISRNAKTKINRKRSPIY